ncbi:oligosaccharide flippase family protein [Caldibacillus thermoamylovorans]
MNNSFNKNISSLVFSTIFCAILSFLLGVLSRRFLLPEEYGLWMSVSLIFLYGPLSHLGVINSINILLPRYISNMEDINIAKILFHARKVLIYNTIVITSIAIISLLFTKNNLIFLSIIYVVIQNYYLYYAAYYSASNNFVTVSKIQTYNSIMSFIISIVLIDLLNVYSLILGLILSNLICIYLYRRKYITKSKDLVFSIRYFKILINIGLPLLLTSITWTFFTTIDRLFIINYMSLEELGFYSIPIFMFQTLMLIPQAYSRVLYTRFNSLYFHKEKRLVLLKEVISSSNVITYIILLIFGLAYLNLPFFTELIFPNYMEGVNAGRTILIGIVFLSMIWVFIVGLNSLEKQKYVLLFTIIGILISILLNFTFIEGGITGIALATSLTGIIFFIMLSSYFFIVLKTPIFLIIRYYLKSLVTIGTFYFITIKLSDFENIFLNSIIYILLLITSVILFEFRVVKELIKSRRNYAK